MENTKDTPRIHFNNLDTLRFLAAYMIVLLHCFFGWKVKFGQPQFLTSLSSQWTEKLEMVMHNFSFGVDIFFIISGFLITYLLLSEREKSGKVDILKFYIRRAFRIWPLYFFMILLAPLLTYFLNEQSPTYIYHFFFAGNFDLIEHGPKSVATNHLWSICIEEHFYLVCPLLIGLIPLKKLPQVLLFIVFICILFRGFCLIYTSDYGMASYVHTLSRIDILALGSLFGYLFYHKRITFNHSLPVRLIVYTVFILVFFNTSYIESGNFFADTMKKYIFAIPVAYWMGNFLFNPDAVLLSPKPHLTNLFGKVSYGIYMFNPVIIFVLICLFEKYAYQNYFVFLGLVHVSLVITTYLSYRFIELPFLALKEKYAVIKSGNKLDNDNESSDEDPLTDPAEVTEPKVVNVIPKQI
jgi:peptidoglycan/LPS O-acetylase OafA/YrhL